MPHRCMPPLALPALPLLLAACAAPPPASDTLGIAFVRVPAGEFSMGSDEPASRLAASYPGLEPSRFEGLSDEAPVHRVRITRPFEMARHEVTVGQFRAFLQRSGHVPESIADGTGGYGYNPAYDPATTPRRDAFEGRSPRYSWQNPGFAQGDDHPVVNVTWNDATALARWLTQQEGRTYRLPTEAEWEYACRAGGTGRYQHGDDPAGLVRVGNTFDADAAANWPAWRARALPGHDGHAFTAPVGRYAPNAFGLYDLHGNVWEWVSDWYGEDYYARSPTDDPQGPADGSVKVRRGGSWHTWPLYARCGFRNWNTVQTRYTLVGIRLVREPKR
ncbi:MAG: formylglycine-generating enzyme family protein [Comamonadaceae bacterium]|uniref:Formylglycine-generating enzyme family protein n=1 Tax=Hydrogenophaga borbori TaxID=2294117 RepID=A0A372EPZ2_9BURK|nr:MULTISPECIES: formylglycine-generating enzyme family protein [Hydrogenophaga]NCT95986.1 formylglycine-generating enzyme family protein [Comamonadaceae bacterium]RFP82693.1 formylglycine-generating enzyme family protein [Hydrogenophaga borbori]WQB82307.1 formylglycine-generating enzyme family protein [Hydrogenophaga sp. SNF1]